MKVEALRPRGAAWTIRLHEKGGGGDGGVSAEFGVHPKVISTWKQELMKRSNAVDLWSPVYLGGDETKQIGS
jgi:hypothetical protein